MPSFDIVSEFDQHEMSNAVDQASKELDTRFDFRGIEAGFNLKDGSVELYAAENFHITQLEQMLRTAMARRKLDVRVLGAAGSRHEGRLTRAEYPLTSGIEQAKAKAIVKKIKDSKLKVQASINGDQVRVTGKKRDDLQQVMQLLRESDDIGIPLQFNNFRD